MYGGTDGEGEPLYGLAPTEPDSVEIERKPHESGNVVTVLVDSGASGYYFDDLIIAELKHRLQDHTSLRTPRTILTAGGAHRRVSFKASSLTTTESSTSRESQS